MVLAPSDVVRSEALNYLIRAFAQTEESSSAAKRHVLRNRLYELVEGCKTAEAWRTKATIGYLSQWKEHDKERLVSLRQIVGERSQFGPADLVDIDSWILIRMGFASKQIVRFLSEDLGKVPVDDCGRLIGLVASSDLENAVHADDAQLDLDVLLRLAACGDVLVALGFARLAIRSGRMSLKHAVELAWRVAHHGVQIDSVRALVGLLWGQYGDAVFREYSSLFLSSTASAGGNRFMFLREYWEEDSQFIGHLLRRGLFMWDPRGFVSRRK